MRRCARVTMREMPAPSASAFAGTAGNACAAALSLIHVRCIVGAIKARANDATWLTALSRTPSLAFWQEKNFSCAPACSLGLTPQAPSYLRIIAHRFATRTSRARVADERFAMIWRCEEANATAKARRPRARSSETELRFQEIVDGLRVRLAAGRLHHLADEPAERLRLRLGLRHLVRIGRDDLVDHLFDRREVGDLLHAARFDDGAGLTALLPDDLEQILGNLAGDGALPDQVDNRTQLLGGDRRTLNIPAFLVETAEQFVDHPVRRHLAVALLVGKLRQHGFIEVRALALGDQHAGIIGGQGEVGGKARLFLVRQFRQVSL